MLRDMNDPACVVRLEFSFDGESPRGRAVGRGEAERRFAGWLGLVAAIEALVDDDAREGRMDGASESPMPRQEGGDVTWPS